MELASSEKSKVMLLTRGLAWRGGPPLQMGTRHVHPNRPPLPPQILCSSTHACTHRHRRLRTCKWVGISRPPGFGGCIHCGGLGLQCILSIWYVPNHSLTWHKVDVSIFHITILRILLFECYVIRLGYTMKTHVYKSLKYMFKYACHSRLNSWQYT